MATAHLFIPNTFHNYIKRAGDKPQNFEDFFKKRNYHFFINGGERHACNDEFTLVRVPSPKYIRGQIDFLMIPQESDRYQIDYKNWMFYNPFKFLWNRLINFLGTLKAHLKGLIVKKAS